MVPCVTKHTLTWDTLPPQSRQGDRADLLHHIPACLRGTAHAFRQGRSLPRHLKFLTHLPFTWVAVVFSSA